MATDAIRVLHVDDEPEFVDLTAQLLRRVDDRLDVVSTTDVETAHGFVTGGRIDCVVSDYEMPGTSGLDFLAAVRADDPDLPFILFTGKGSEEIAADAIAAGVTDYLQKATTVEQYAILANRVVNAVEHARAERSLREERDRYRTVVENTNDAIFIFQHDRLVFVNQRACELTGYNHADLDGTEPWSLVHPGDRDRLESYATRRANGEASPSEYEARLLTADGTARQCMFTVERITYRGEFAVLGTVRDLTERNARNEELARKSSLLDTLFATIPVHLYVKDAEGRHCYVSNALFGEYGDPASVIGETDLALVETGLVSEEHARSAYEDDLRVIKTGEPVLGREEYNPDVDRWFSTSKVPWTDDDGEIIGLIGLTFDVTDRKEREHALERQNERLEHFSSIVSHDLRSPLNLAQGHVALAQEECDCPNLSTASDALVRMEHLVTNLLALARDGETVSDVEPVALASFVEECWQVVTAETATLRVTADVMVRADRSRLRQVFENLFRNAVEHAGPDVTVTVGELDDRDGFYVEDDGPGLPDNNRERVFEYGYSTRKNGTGFGLAIVDQIASAHGWSITVTEGAAGGVRFEFDVSKSGEQWAGVPPPESE